MSTPPDARAAVFDAAYAALNDAQRRAVDTIEGPVMVVAGPGTGKTQILTLRIANILRQTDTPPEGILALTFTESGAKAMRERLRSYIGAAAYRVPIYTFHGFAETLIRRYPDAYEKVIGGRPASDLEKIELIEQVLDSGGFVKLRPHGDPRYYVRPILGAISDLKQEYLTPDRFAEALARQEAALDGIPRYHEKGAHKGKERGEYTKAAEALTKNRELLAAYRQYEALLRDRRLYDFDDMIVETVAALEGNESMLRDLQETYLYLLADEHQDVNGSQNRILELLAAYHDQPNIFAVGDEKQAIFRFQGASLENFLYFDEAFPTTTTIALTENYRSGQPILDAAHALITEGADERLLTLRVPLEAAAIPVATLEFRQFAHQAVEDAFVIEAVTEAIAAGTPPAEVAVIVRTNREVERFAALLRKAGIAARPSADSDIMLHPVTQSVLALMRAAVDPSDEAALLRVLHGAYWGITPADLVRLAAARSYATPLAALLADQAALEAAGIGDPATIVHVGAVLTRARDHAVAVSPAQVLEHLVSESGLLAHLAAADPLEGGRVLRRLYDEVESLTVHDGLATLADVEAALGRREQYGLPLNAPFIATDQAAVAVMTAHKSKGLEFDLVVAPHLHDRLWGGGAKRQLFRLPLAKHVADSELDPVDDERRLLYVVLTRARRQLLLSFADTSEEGKEQVATRLLTALPETLLTVSSTSDFAAAFSPTDSLAPAPSRSVLEPTLLTALMAERGFSATSLNNYLRSPWDYLYRNILRLPEVRTTSLLYGTALHAVLERATRHHTTAGVMPSFDQVRGWLSGALNRLPLTAVEHASLHERGLAALTVYLEHCATTLPTVTREEFRVRVMLPTGLPELPELPLTGSLDRLDLAEDGTVLRVVDYKTGKPRSRGYIEGTTKDSDGGYKRQLTFYALLLSLYEDARYSCNEGLLTFVEPDAKGVVREEAFTITDEEVAALRTEIIRAAGEFVSGAFLTAPHDAAATDYHDLVALLLRVPGGTTR